MLNIRSLYFIVVAFCLILIASCSDDDKPQPVTGFSEFTPQEGGYGTQVLISGENFPVNTSAISVTINGIDIPIIRSNEEQILVEIPKNKEIGTFPIVVTVNGESFTSSANFTYMRTRTVSTLAGTGERGYQDGPGSEAKFSFTTEWNETRRGGIDVDDDLNVYVSDAANQCIRKIAPDGTVTTVAGQGPNVEITDWGINWRHENGGTGSYNAQIRPTDVKVDSKGNMYVPDDYIGGMVMFEPDGKAHYLGWGGGINCIAVDEANNTLYLNDHNAGIIYTSSMDNYGPSPAAVTPIISGVQWSAGMVVDKRNGDFYLVYHDANKILRYKRGDWNNPTVVAGSGTEGFLDGSALSARFFYPWGIAMDPDGNLYVAGNGDSQASSSAQDQSIRFIDYNSGFVTTFAGNGSAGYTDGEFAIQSYAGTNSATTMLPSSVRFSAPTGVAVDKNGTVYVLDRGNNVVRKIVTE